MATISEDIIKRFPEIDFDVDGEKFKAVLVQAGCIYGGTYNSSQCVNEILLNLVAHLYLIEIDPQLKSSLTQSSIASKSVGSVSVTYSTGSTIYSGLDESFYEKTPYGRMFLFLTSKKQGAFFV